MNGLIERIIAPGVVFVAFVGSLQWQIRTKVSKDHFNDVVIGLREQNGRIESHLWDIMREQKIKPTIDPPDEIKNSNNRKEA